MNSYEKKIKFMQINYENKINECIKEYENNLKKTLNSVQLTKLTNAFFEELFCISIFLNKEQFNNYIKILKKNKIYNYKAKQYQKFILKNFTKLYIYVYMFKNSNRNFFSMKFIFIRNIFHNARILKNKLQNKSFLKQLDFIVTTKCTLKCEKCLNLISQYNNPYDVNEDFILNSIKKIDESITFIHKFRILGGEPFCNPKLKEYLKLLPIEKFGQIVIVTNGTIVPKDEELISLIKKKKIFIEISNYGNFSDKKDELIQLLRSKKIKYTCDKEQIEWYDYGDVIRYNKTEEQLNEQFFRCNMSYGIVLNGIIYFCPRQAHAHDLGLVKRKENEYVDLLSNSAKENRKQIKKIFSRKEYIEICKYCKYATPICRTIQSAKQKNNEIVKKVEDFTEKKYTILIVVYNGGKTIKKCLDSIENQTIKNFEVIVVDDGSTDNTKEIVKKYKNVKYFYKENSGVADTRNYAISKVETPYFMFLDCDDYIAEDLIEECEKYSDYDVLSFCAVRVDKNYDEIESLNKESFKSLNGPRALQIYMKNHDFFLVPWGYIYKTSFIKKNNFKYNKNYVMEDTELTPIIIFNAKKVISINYYGYYYYQSDESITRTCNGNKILFNIKSFIHHYDSLIEYFESRVKNKNDLKLYESFVANTLLWYGSTISGKYLSLYVKELKKRKVIEKFYPDDYVGKTKKLLCKIDYRLYYFIYYRLRNTKLIKKYKRDKEWKMKLN